MIISKLAHVVSKIILILELYEFLTLQLSYTWSFGHSDPDLSSVSGVNHCCHLLHGTFKLDLVP